VATVVIASANTTIPAMITNTSNCGRPDHGHQAGGVHNCVVHGVEQSGDQHAGAGAVVEPASHQAAAWIRRQEDV
jgi:hypothetical protein